MAYRGGRVACGIIAATLICGHPASAAVRVCAPLVVGEPQVAANELRARILALQAWSKASQPTGSPASVPGAWRIATDKQLTCAPVGQQLKGATTCVARARPCRIEQAPGRTPPPTVPRAPGSRPKGPKVLSI
jgi:hypothetical protein